MKLIDNILYLEFSDALECSFSSENYLKKAFSIGSKSFTCTKDPSDGRKVLIEYSSLKQHYKDKVIARFGDPYEYMAKQPIRDMVTNDTEAQNFFFSYKYDNKKNLPIENVNAYTKAASWLNMLVSVEENKKEIKRKLNLSLSQFWTNVADIIKADKIDLPASYKRLTEKIDEYKTGSYASLIHKHFGNGNARKVDCEISESVLLEICSSVRYKDDMIRAKAYNTWAVANGKEQITPDTVGKWRRKNDYQLKGQREGGAAWYNTHGKQIMRRRPSAPLLLIGSDGNELDLYYIKYETNKKGHNSTNYFHRKTLVVVMDAFNDYILGYAVGDEEETGLIRLAYIDMMHHIHQLTGGWYLPHQLQTDRWGNGTMDEFYKSFTTYTPARARAPRGKYIEQAFGNKWHQHLQLHINHAGHNVTAVTKLNTEHLQAVKKDFPLESQAHLQIEQFVSQMRLLTDDNGVTRQQHWIDAFTRSELSQKRKIDELQMLLHFGISHSHLNTITNRGIAPAINCKERVYEIPDKHYLECVGKKMQVVYDPLDYSRILVTDNANTRFIAYEYDKMPSAIADYQPGDRTRLNARLEEKKRHVEQISAAKDKRQATLSRNNIDAHSLLQAGLHHLPKEQKQLVERTYHNSKNNQQPDEMDDFDMM